MDSDIGTQMRAARTARRVELADAAQVLKIRKAYLEALESNNLRALPGRTYALGFVRSYAQYLGMDVEACVAHFRGELDKSGLTPQFAFPEIEPDHRFARSGWLTGGAVMAVMLLGMWLFSGSDDAYDADTQVVASMEAPEDAAFEALEASGPSKVALSGDAALARTSILSEGSDYFADGTEISTSLRASDIDPLNAAANSTGLLRNPAVSPRADAAQPQTVARLEAAPSSSPAPSSAGALTPAYRPDVAPEITLAALADAWVRLEDDNGNVLISRTLAAGERFTVPARAQGLVLVARDAGAVELIVNGQSRGPAGPRGRVLTGMNLDPVALSRAPVR